MSSLEPNRNQIFNNSMDPRAHPDREYRIYRKISHFWNKKIDRVNHLINQNRTSKMSDFSFEHLKSMKRSLEESRNIALTTACRFINVNSDNSSDTYRFDMENHIRELHMRHMEKEYNSWLNQNQRKEQTKNRYSLVSR